MKINRAYWAWSDFDTATDFEAGLPVGRAGTPPLPAGNSARKGLRALPKNIAVQCWRSSDEMRPSSLYAD